MILLAIDPGSAQSAWVLYDTETRKPVDYAKADNHVVLHMIPGWRKFVGHLAVEMTACYGMTAGRDLFDTTRWIGRFIQAWGESFNLVLRKSRWGPGPDDYMDAGQFPGVCMTLCKMNTAKDPQVRQAIIDRFGGSKAAAIGIKAAPGSLYGMKADVWAALAVALTWAEHMGEPGAVPAKPIKTPLFPNAEGNP